MADLKLCPFCGSEAMFRHIFENPDKCMVGCRGCDVVIDAVFPNEQEAAKEWNDQALASEIAALQADNERLRAENVRLKDGVAQADKLVCGLIERYEFDGSADVWNPCEWCSGNNCDSCRRITDDDEHKIGFEMADLSFMEASRAALGEEKQDGSI